LSGVFWVWRFLHGGAATNLASAVEKTIIATFFALRIIFTDTTINEIDLLSRTSHFCLIVANILTEANAVLLEEIMIVQHSTVFKAT